VSLLHGGRQACVRFNGWRTALFPIVSGVAQGSPLSPLLYVLAAQPLAAYIRRLGDGGLLRGIPFPDGSVAPFTHQHADDLTVHVAALPDAQVVMQGPIRLFCQASGAEVHAGKAKGLHLGVPQPWVGVDQGTGIRFVDRGEPVRHLGILVGTDPEECRRTMYAGIAAKLERRVASWSSSSLSLLGRAYVARQCMASMFTYHATFVPPPDTFLRRAAGLFATFVECGARADPSRRAAGLHPNRGVSALPWEQGGMRFPDVHAIAIALQSSVISRLLRPNPAPWKGMFIQWLGRPAAWVQAHPAVPPRDIDCWGLGARALFCTEQLPLHSRSSDGPSTGVPTRVLSYVRAFRRLFPHRDGPAASFSAIMAEPLFFNAAVTDARGRPLSGEEWRRCAAGGVRRVGDLRLLYRPPLEGPPQGLVLGGLPHPDVVQFLLQALPPAWRAMVLQPEEPFPDWAAWGQHPGLFLRRLDPVSPGTGMMLQVFQMQVLGRVASGRVTATGQVLTPAEVCRRSLVPAVVDVWDRGRPGPPLDLAARTFVFGAGHPWPFDPRPWMVGTTSVLSLTASIAAQRWRDIRLWETQPGHTHTAFYPIRPPIWEDDWSPGALPPTGLRAAEERHLDKVRALPVLPPTPTRRRPRGEGDAAELADLELHRPPAARLSITEGVAPRPPPRPVRRLPQARWPDTTDVLAPRPQDPPPRPPWRHVWGAIAHSGLSLVERACAFRILHGCIFTGVFKAYIGMPISHADRFCQHATCGAPHYDTLRHVFLTCPLADQVWGWLGDLWESLTDGRFPLSVAVLLADDRREWQPAPDAVALWLRLRVLTLAALWKAHCSRSHGERTPLVIVIAGLVSRIRAVMSSDAALVDPDRPRLATVGGDTVLTPLPSFTRAAFLSRWGLRGLLCSWPEDAARPVLHLTLGHPAPIPREQQLGG
jgi:hypothetical protein